MVAASYSQPIGSSPPTIEYRLPPVRLLTPAQMKSQARLTWLVKDMLPRHGFALLVGAKESYKTFLALDLAFSVASGKPWHGINVQRGPVVYISVEGQTGMGQRIAAWEVARQQPAPLGCMFWNRAVQMHVPEHVSHFLDGLDQEIAEGKLEGKPSLVVVDTLARCFEGGEENSAMEVGRFVAGVDRIRERTRAAVLVIHHPGRGKKTQSRGSYALDAAVDTIMTVSREAESREIVVACTKQKDADHFKKFTMLSRKIQLSDGESSLVLDLENEGLTDFDKVVLNRLRKFGACNMARLREVLAGAMKGKFPNGPSEKTLRPRLNVLQDLGYIKVERRGQGGEHWYEWTGQGWL